MPLLLPEYAIHAKMLVEMTEEIALKVLEKTSANNYQNEQMLLDVAALHYLLCKVDQDNFMKKYESWVNARVPTMGFHNVNASLAALVEKKMIREYKDTLSLIVGLLQSKTA
eukprot:TRINITY_DN5044_c0_g1_i12.p1 TRINITY_DN5044_c0_g1~~TRINITY_DN5044_c0_g1_i12.p1  ORF type:complete len:112 (+),score=17.67 TRINITY_DN5044_c0_g1_i12:98-433(+)